ncbi:uncharacterized protein LOC115421861 [Sphaeramia orbicularis]|uniref:uncharacterized protein LOC115421861 n=1 Tax=Sphaeramia orbicularis TaxID=375764 RepID=UPI00117EE144|nr:uncharacterized protein LOC115421861 [Sphaeramia orbicularis]
MPSCCVVGCKSRDLRNRKLTFYIIPLETKRRNLWLQAIQRVNGDDYIPEKNALICGAHFVSGEVSMDHDNPDFVPSVFTYSNRKPTAQKVKRKHGSECYASSVGTNKETPLPDGELSEVKKGPSTPSLPKEIKMVSEEEEMENGVINIKSEVASSLQWTSLSHETAAILKLDTRRPVILLKSVLNGAGVYQCDSCNRNFTVVSQFVKHKQQHDEERPLSNDEDVSVPFEISEKPIKNEAFTEHILTDEHSFKCNMCERSFPTSHNLKRHKLLHLKDGRKCGQCGVLFCRRHSHILFRPQAVPKNDVEEDASANETQPVNVHLTPENSQKVVEPNPKAEFADKSHDAMNQSVSPMSSKPEPIATISMSKTTTKCPLTSFLIPDPKMLDPSRPPSPTLIRYNRKTPPYHFSPNPINYHKHFVQPHLPVLPELPPSLQMFSPQYLTSSFLEVKRNYACIFGKLPTVNVIKEEPCALPVVTPPQQQQHKKIKKETLETYDWKIVR